MEHIKYYEEIVNEGIIDDALDWLKTNVHYVLPALEIGAMFIPVIGPFLAMGIGMTDASIYWDEGDKTAAGVSAAFSLLPGIGMITKTIPGIKTLGKEGMETLGKKVLGKSGAPLTKTEQGVMKEIAANPKLIQKGLRQDMEHKAMKKFDPKCALKSIAESVEPYIGFINEAKGACSIYTKSIMDISMKDPGLLVGYGGMLKKGSIKLSDSVELITVEIKNSIRAHRSGGYPVNNTNNISDLLMNRSDNLRDHYNIISKNIKGFEGSDFALNIKKQSNNLRELANKSDGYYKHFDDQVGYAKEAIAQLDDTAKLYTTHYKKLNDIHIDGKRIEKAFLKEVKPVVKPKVDPIQKLDDVVPTKPISKPKPIPKPIKEFNPGFSKRASEDLNDIDKVMNRYFKGVGGYDDAMINKVTSIKKRYRKLEFDVIDGKKLSNSGLRSELKRIDDELLDVQRYIENNRHLDDFAANKNFYTNSDKLASRGDFSLRHPSGAITDLRKEISDSAKMINN
jgi:hypothetical protein